MKHENGIPNIKEIAVTYNKTWEILDVPTQSTDWHPKYLKYCLEYLEIPMTPRLRIKFLDRSVVFDDFLKEVSK